MAFIPKDAIWYIAQVILEITVEGEARNVVHVNYLLVRAESPVEAYEKALRLGAEHETTYCNRQQKTVTTGFHSPASWLTQKRQQAAALQVVPQ